MKTGIYVEYHDHLSCDAFKVWAYREDKNLLTSSIFEKLSDNKYYREDMEKSVKRFGCIEVTMMSDSGYYGTKGLKTVVKILQEEFPDLKVKCFTQGWYTFPSTYMSVGGYFTKYLSPDVEMIEGNGEGF